MAKPSPTHSGDPTLIAIGRAIRERRAECALSQETLAHEAGIDRSYMGGVERGEHNITVMNLARICAPLGIEVSKLLRRAGL